MCGRCDSSLKKVGEFTQDAVTFVPATYMIVRHHYPQYRCSNCEPETKDEEGLITAPATSLLNGTICDPSLLAQIVKVINHKWATAAWIKGCPLDGLLTHARNSENSAFKEDVGGA